MLRLDGLSLGFWRYSGLLRRRFDTRLSDLSLEIGRGEVLALVGASGAGKSLLAHAILGLLPVNAALRGTMSFDGQSLLGQHPHGYPHALRGRRIALMPQGIAHLDPLAQAGRQLRWAQRRTRGAAAPGHSGPGLTDLGLPETVGALYPHQLSGGMARRVLLALAASGGPDLLIADEPTTGLDPESRDRVLSALRARVETGGSVLLVTHDLAAALPIADRVAVLEEGRLVGIEAAAAFRGEGEALASPQARAFWRALPQNGFHADA